MKEIHIVVAHTALITAREHLKAARAYATTAGADPQIDFLLRVAQRFTLDALDMLNQMSPPAAEQPAAKPDLFAGVPDDVRGIMEDYPQMLGLSGGPIEERVAEWREREREREKREQQRKDGQAQ